ncbi:hypothetical protein GOODEAATRI_005930 [Goodea atripinnis]|uniref:Anoctamin n=1 Tax=Goodea atripinnis TaxID=208336 RepID=A0ABV0NS69_9TELE
MTFSPTSTVDYQEMFVQFGYVVLFSSAFPLAAMCALINNIIEIRSDAFKLCTGLQRPFGVRVESIGQWQHFAVLLKYIIHVAIPDIPTWVKEEMSKLDYQRREAFKAEHLARRERERDDSKGDSSGDHHHDKNHGTKSRSGGSGGGGGVGTSGSDKPKRPSSLLANNNVMKLKQIIPLQSSSSQERSQSPSKAFNPGKLFNFGKSEGGTCVNGAPLPRPGDGSSSQTSERQASRSDLNGVPDEIPSPPGEGSENGHATDLDPAGSKM